MNDYLTFVMLDQVDYYPPFLSSQILASLPRCLSPDYTVQYSKDGDDKNRWRSIDGISKIEYSKRIEFISTPSIILFFSGK